MKKKQTKTTVSGIKQTEAAWIVRATATRNGVTTEDERVLPKATTSFVQAQAAQKAMKAALVAAFAEASVIQPTLGDFAPQWFESLKARKKKIKASFFKIRTIYLESFILNHFGNKQLKAIKTSDVERWKDALAGMTQPHMLNAAKGMRRNPNGGEPYASETLKSIWGCAKQLFAFAYRRSDIGHLDPMANAVFDIEGRERVSKEALTPDELRRLLPFLEEEAPKYKPMILMQLTQGMRHAEASAFHWCDLDLAHGRFTIVRSQVNGESGMPKTEATRRTGKLLPEVVEALIEYREWYEANEPLGSQAGIVFPSNSGGYMQPSVISEVLRRCAAKAGVDKHISSHCLRGTAVNRYRQTSDGATARKMVGHSKNAEEMTVRYSSADDEERIEIQRRAFGDALQTKKETPKGKSLGVGHSQGVLGTFEN